MPPRKQDPEDDDVQTIDGDGTAEALPTFDDGEAVQAQEAPGFDAEAEHRTAVDGMLNITDQLQIDTQSMVFDVRDFLLDQIKSRPKPWSATSQGEQRDVAAACEHAANEVVRKIVEAVASRGAVPVRVPLTKVTLGTDMVIAGKVKTFDPEEEDRAVETLHKAIGKHVLLTVATTEDYKTESREAPTDPDEPDFAFEAGEETDSE